MNPHNQIHSKLLAWYKANARDLPWRNTHNPYKVWLSEIILQQTRVAQGLPYYQIFFSTFPTVQKLAKAPESVVLKLWQGLGYYSRARNMLKAAKTIVADFEGNFPTTSKELQKLPGIGSYTAAAIASFCFKEPIAVIDGNVFRVLSRLKNVETPINVTEGITEFNMLANELLNHHSPDLHNQAMMELGAMVCTPQNPKCEICPLAQHCIALSLNNVTKLPVKLAKKAKRTRYFNYLMLQKENGNTFMQQRKAKDIWQNMFEFPLVETSSQVNHFQQLMEDFGSFGQIRFDVSGAPKYPIIHKHVLTHQLIFASFWNVPISTVEIADNCDIFEVELSKIQSDLAIPKLIHNYLTDLNPVINVD